MPNDTLPMRARDGMTVTVTETFIKLFQLTLATRDAHAIRAVMDSAQIPGDDRIALFEALADRKGQLQDKLREQVNALAILNRDR